MFYVVPAETTFADIFATKGFVHRGKFHLIEDAKNAADARKVYEGRDYAVIEIRRVCTTETIDTAAGDATHA